MRAQAPAPSAVNVLTANLVEKFPRSAIVLYGSGNSVLRSAAPDEVLYDFYVITRSYRDSFSSPVLRFLNWLLPPNVFYVETPGAEGTLRAKYAVLSISHFERLVSKKTFHSYFWARFAQPCRIVTAPADLRKRVEAAAATAVETFVDRSAPLAPADAPAFEIWRQGLRRSYKSELRAEKPGRVTTLLESYGDWPDQVTRRPAEQNRLKSKALIEIAWSLRMIQGGILSVLRIAKATATFQGGVDYMVWKIRRHSGVDIPVKAWERRHPLLGAPFLAFRYYRLRRRQHF